MTERTLRRSTSPPKMPLRSGAARVVRTSSPKWRRTKVATDSSASGAAARSSAARPGSAAVGALGFGGEQRGVFERAEVRGDHHAHAFGDGFELAVFDDVGDARAVVGGDELAFEAEFDGELAGPGFFADPGVGTAFKDKAVMGRSFDDAAEAVGGFVEMPVDVGAALAGEFEFVGGGEAGDTSAEDGDTGHRNS